MSLSSNMSTYNIPKIEDGPASKETFNTPLVYIEGALNQLSSKINSNTNKQSVIQWQAPVASDVVAGDLVYWDTSIGVFKKALANTSKDNSGKRVRT